MSSFSERSAGLRKVYRALRKAYGKQVPEPADDMAHELLRFILMEEADEASVDKAMKRISQDFVDLNEVRVSFPREIAEVMPEVSNAEQKASRVTRLFNSIFLRHNTMTWDFLRTMGVREVRQLFEKLDGGGEVLAAAAVLLSGGHAVPADADVARTLSRLGLTAKGEDTAGLQAFLERAVARDEGYETWALLHRLGESACLPDKPQCAKCPVRTMCPTGAEALAVKKPAGRTDKNEAARPAGTKKSQGAKKAAAKKSSSRAASSKRAAPSKRKK
jgi:endonuclease-3